MAEINTFQDLEKMSIYVLRELARRTGVSSPTSKKKDQLIKEISAINNGEQQPCLSKTKQGRPPKSLTFEPTIQSIEMDILNRDFNETRKFKLCQKVNNSVFENEDVETVCGYVEIVNEQTSVLWKFDANGNVGYIIPSRFINEYNLRTGDLILCSVEDMQSHYSVKNIFSINGIPVAKFDKQRISFNNIENSTPKEKINFSLEKTANLNLKYGEIVYFKGTDNALNTKSILSLLNSCDADKKIYINTNVTEKNKTLIEGQKDIELFTARVTDESDYANRTIFLAVERMKRLFELSKTIVVALDDMTSIYVQNKESFVLKSLLSNIKCSNNGAISLFAVVAENYSDQPFASLCDKVVEIKPDKFETIK